MTFVIDGLEGVSWEFAQEITAALRFGFLSRKYLGLYPLTEHQKPPCFLADLFSFSAARFRA